MASFTKSELRQSMKLRLSTLDPGDYQNFNVEIRDKFFVLTPVKNAAGLMIYYSIHHEVETHVIIEGLLALGKMVALPVCTPEKNLKAALIKDLSELVPVKFGLYEPSKEAPLIAPSKLDLIVIPGLAFDEQGHRLGHGGGYYDRFLAGVPGAFRLGLAYDFQVLKKLPADTFDQPVNALLTPTRYMEFSN